MSEKKQKGTTTQARLRRMQKRGIKAATENGQLNFSFLTLGKKKKG